METENDTAKYFAVFNVSLFSNKQKLLRSVCVFDYMVNWPKQKQKRKRVIRKMVLRNYHIAGKR